MSNSQLPTRDQVIAICEANGPKSNGVEFNSRVWIKYGIDVTEAEAIIQQHIHDHANHDILYTPKVYDCFTVEQPGMMRTTYIVQEMSTGVPFAEYKKQWPSAVEEMYIKIGDAVRHLWKIEPSYQNIGPPKGQIPHGRFFSDYGAGRTFQNVAELQVWINTILENAGRPERVNCSQQVPRLRHCDLTQFNVHVQPHTKRVILLDWGDSGNFPVALEEYALIHQINLPGGYFARKLHKELFGSELSVQMRPLCRFVHINAFGG